MCACVCLCVHEHMTCLHVHACHVCVCVCMAVCRLFYPGFVKTFEQSKLVEALILSFPYFFKMTYLYSSVRMFLLYL